MIVTPMLCSRCKISSYCPDKGSSPVRVENSNYMCHILGGYATTIAPRDKLSGTSLKLYDMGRNCVTFVDVPKVSADGQLYYLSLTVMHPVLEHLRSRSSVITTDDLTPKNSR